MFRFVPKLVSTALATLVLVGVSSALAVVPYRERSAGTLTEVAPGHVAFAAEGRATHFGNYSMEGSNDLDTLGNVLNGHLTVTTVGGATIQGNFSGTYTPLSTGQILFEVTVTWHSGTGRLEGVTGEADVTALIDGVFPGAAIRAQGFGSLVLP